MTNHFLRIFVTFVRGHLSDFNVQIRRTVRRAFGVQKNQWLTLLS